MRRRLSLIAFLLAIGVAAISGQQAASPAADWPMYARDYGSTGFSPLTEITPANVSKLKQVCSYPLPEQTAFESSLVVIGGTMYFTSGEYTYALDAADCTLRWRVRHEGGSGAVRGVAVAGDRLFRGFRDGTVGAYKVSTGEPLWEVKLRESDGTAANISGSPLAWNGMVFVGTAGAERACYCFVAGLDGATGKEIWRFQLVPTGDAPGAETWPKGVRVGGGSSWTSFSLDTSAGLLWVPTGNPGPDFHSAYRPGANLYTGSIVALEARTGRLRTWYQLVPHDYHDWDQAAAPTLFTTTRGRQRVVAGGKDGILHGVDVLSKKIVWQTAVSTRKNVDAPLTPEGTYFCPGAVGGVEWNGPTYSALTNLVYVNSVDWCLTLKLDPKMPVFEAGKSFLGSADGMGVKDTKKSGWVTAIDPETGAIRWRHETGSPMVGGSAVTASGLLLTGDLNGDFLAFDAATGKVLHRISTKQPIGGGVVTYQAGGAQRVAIAAGMRNAIFRTEGQAVVIVFGL